MDSHQKKQAIYVKGVSKSFKQGSDSILALKSVNFHAFSNEILLIVGPSGCGKTTLLSVIAGTLKCDEGEIYLFDVPIHNLTSSKITSFRKKNIGFIFQQYHLIPTLTCLENVSVPLLLNGVNKSIAEQRSAEVLARVGLKGKEKSKPYHLSGGQQQRVSIARALVHEPSFLICDEPTAALDADTGSLIMSLLAEISKDPNRCIIVVTHDNRIFKYADRIVKMDDGQILNTEDR